MKSLHIGVQPSVAPKLKEYSLSRSTSMTAVINNALEALFHQEDMDFAKHTALKEAVYRRFSVPSAYPLKAFLTTLWILAKKHPNSSAQAFWDVPTYLSSVDRTHKEILTEIKEEVARVLEKK